MHLGVCRRSLCLWGVSLAWMPMGCVPCMPVGCVLVCLLLGLARETSDDDITANWMK